MFVPNRDTGMTLNSYYYIFEPSEVAKKYYFYLAMCGHFYCTEDYKIERNTFAYLLLVYVRNGHFHVNYNNETIIAKKGEVILIDCRLPHLYFSSHNLEFVYMHFDGANSHELCNYIIKQHGILFQGKGATIVGKLLYEMIVSFKNDCEYSPAECSGMIYNIITNLTINSIKNEGNENTPIQYAVQYIKDNLNKPLTLKSIANHVNLSTFYFSHLFKEETSYSPIEYVITMRINTAKLLLKTTNMLISEIATEVGYNSNVTFINAFKERVGMPPTKFRNSPI